MLRTSILLLSLIACPALVSFANAQLPLSPHDTQEIAPAFDAPPAKSLNGLTESWPPSLDFALRFVSGYVVHCRVSQFDGKQTVLSSYLKVTPQGKPSRLFGSAYRLPEIPPEMLTAAGGDLHKLKNEIAFSGAVGVGEGRYTVELLVVDDQHRSCRKRWRVHAKPNHSQHDVRLAIEPLTVEALDRRAWQVLSPAKRGGLRLTILLDAAPMNPFEARLHAWDRAFLLESVYSVLRQTPYESVRLVAFNLDQQSEILRNDRFGSAGFQDLSRALARVEMASISVEALKRRNSPEFLITLANRELATDHPSDAIIFLGPNARLDARMTTAALSMKKPTSPPFFYFEYFPWVGSDFPDAIQWLMKAADGKTYQIHSPAQLDQAIQKMLAQLKQD